MKKYFDSRQGTNRVKKHYTQPGFKKYGELRDLSKGRTAYSLQEGAYQEMNPPS